MQLSILLCSIVTVTMAVPRTTCSPRAIEQMLTYYSDKLDDIELKLSDATIGLIAANNTAETYATMVSFNLSATEVEDMLTIVNAFQLNSIDGMQGDVEYLGYPAQNDSMEKLVNDLVNAFSLDETNRQLMLDGIWSTDFHRDSAKQGSRAANIYNSSSQIGVATFKTIWKKQPGNKLVDVVFSGATYSVALPLDKVATNNTRKECKHFWFVKYDCHQVTWTTWSFQAHVVTQKEVQALSSYLDYLVSKKFATNYAPQIQAANEQVQAYMVQVREYTKMQVAVEKKIAEYNLKCAQCPGCTPPSVKKENKH